MEIQVDLTQQDLVDFNLYHHKHSRTSRRTKWTLALPGLLWSGFWLWMCALSDDFVKSATALMPLLVGGPLYILTLFVLWRRGMAKQVKQYLAEGENKGIFGPRRVWLTPEGIREEGALRSSTSQWQAAERIVVLPDAIYIYISALAAYIIPRRSFTSESHFHEFVAEAQRYHSDARG